MCMYCLKFTSQPSFNNFFVLQAQKDRIFIKGGIVVNDDEMVEADVFIESGLIK